MFRYLQALTAMLLLVVSFAGANSLYAASTNNACPSTDELYEAAAECAAEGYLHYTYYDSDGCKQVACSDLASPSATSVSTCPSWKVLEAAMEDCKAIGMSYEKYSESGCVKVRCIEAPVSCKKTSSGGCVVISCEDGYSYNSCAQDACAKAGMNATLKIASEAGTRVSNISSSSNPMALLINMLNSFFGSK